MDALSRRATAARALSYLADAEVLAETIADALVGTTTKHTLLATAEVLKAFYKIELLHTQNDKQHMLTSTRHAVSPSLRRAPTPRQRLPSPPPTVQPATPTSPPRLSSARAPASFGAPSHDRADANTPLVVGETLHILQPVVHLAILYALRRRKSARPWLVPWVAALAIEFTSWALCERGVARGAAPVDAALPSTSRAEARLRAALNREELRHRRRLLLLLLSRPVLRAGLLFLLGVGARQCSDAGWLSAIGALLARVRRLVKGIDVTCPHFLLTMELEPEPKRGSEAVHHDS